MRQMKGLSFGIVCFAVLVMSTVLPTRSWAQDRTNTVCRVAIVPFRVVNSLLDSGTMGQAFADLVGVSLSQYDNMHVLERSELAKILDEQTLNLLNNTGDGLKIGLTGADYVCVGTYERQTNRVTVAVRVINTVSSSVAGVFRCEGNWSDLDEVSQRLAKDMAAKMSVDQSVQTSGATDRSPRANARYLRGLGSMGQGDYAAAAMEFVAAIEIDPKLTEVHLALAKALMALGQHADAVLEFRTYLRLEPQSTDVKDVVALCLECENRLPPAAKQLVNQLSTKVDETVASVKPQ